MHQLHVSVVVTAYNAAETLPSVMKSLLGQKFPIMEILVIDNHSTDKTPEILADFNLRNKQIPITIIRRTKFFGLMDSYYLGARHAKGSAIVTLHADGFLPSRYELSKLLRPLNKKGVVAVMPMLVLPRYVWSEYNFWQKCSFASGLDYAHVSGNGKFDAFKKDTFLHVLRENRSSFFNRFGGEDTDLYEQLHKYGDIEFSPAVVYHIHPKEIYFGFKDFIRRRKNLSFIYGKHLRKHIHSHEIKKIIFFAKPIVALFLLLSWYHWIFSIPAVVYPFLYMRNMFTDPTSIQNPRILLLPFILIFLLYFESYWQIIGFFSIRNIP